MIDFHMIFHNLTIDRVKQEQKERIQKSSTKTKIEYKNKNRVKKQKSSTKIEYIPIYSQHLKQTL